jgi:hypothetical protein
MEERSGWKEAVYDWWEKGKKEGVNKWRFYLY